MDSTTMWVVIGAVGVSVAGVITYVLFMIFLPEWVGITGKTALDAEKSHQGGPAKESGFWVKMGQEPVKAKDDSPESDSAKPKS